MRQWEISDTDYRDNRTDEKVLPVAMKALEIVCGKKSLEEGAEFLQKILTPQYHVHVGGNHVAITPEDGDGQQLILIKRVSPDESLMTTEDLVEEAAEHVATAGEHLEQADSLVSRAYANELGNASGSPRMQESISYLSKSMTSVNKNLAEMRALLAETREMIRNPEKQKEPDPLLEAATEIEQLEDGQRYLDELVTNTVVNQTSEINNQGTAEQLRFLQREGHNPADILEHIQVHSTSGPRP